MPGHFCEHWAFYHKNDLQDLSCIEIYFLDYCEDPGPAEEDYPVLRNLFSSFWYYLCSCLLLIAMAWLLS